MNTSQKNIAIIMLITMLLTFSANAKAVQKSKYSADVPDFLLTPDKVKTELLGDLEFFDGMPDDVTVKKAYDFLDLSRGVEVFLNGMPAASMYAMLEGLAFVKIALQWSVESKIYEKPHTGFRLNPVLLGDAFRAFRSVIGVK